MKDVKCGNPEPIFKRGQHEPKRHLPIIGAKIFRGNNYNFNSKTLKMDVEGSIMTVSIILHINTDELALMRSVVRHFEKIRLRFTFVEKLQFSLFY